LHHSEQAKIAGHR